MKFKFAVVEGERQEAQPSLSGKCPVCSNAMIAKCGQVRVWHWSHRGTHKCDPWWESETEWHRVWKDHFPREWQEFIQRSEDGEKHIADIKTESGVVIEFQHSNLRREERESREMFYQKMVWVVDGLRRKRYRTRFFTSLGAPTVVKFKPLTFLLPSNEGALLRDWAASRVPVFFDFGDLSEPSDTLRFDKPILWRLNPRSLNGRVYLSPVLKTSFLDAHLKRLPLKGFDCSAVERARSLRAARSFMQQAPRSGAARGFDRYIARKEKRRRRF
jgi:competence protein CoiA